MNGASYYCSQIQVSGSIWTIYGTEEILRTAINEWAEWVANPARENDVLLTINGLSNTVDRAETINIFKMEEIQVMSVYRYG